MANQENRGINWIDENRERKNRLLKVGELFNVIADDDEMHAHPIAKKDMPSMVEVYRVIALCLIYTGCKRFDRCDDWSVDITNLLDDILVEYDGKNTSVANKMRRRIGAHLYHGKQRWARAEPLIKQWKEMLNTTNVADEKLVDAFNSL